MLSNLFGALSFIFYLMCGMCAYTVFVETSFNSNDLVLLTLMFGLVADVFLVGYVYYKEH